MSTAAQVNRTATGTGIEVARPLGRCIICGETIGPEQRFMTALVDTPQGFQRADCSLNCWDKFDRKDVVAFWQAIMPRPEQKKALFVSDEVLCELFARLAEVTEPAKVNFRFVLGLILMRKRLLVYEGSRREETRDVWTLRLRGQDERLELVDPHLGEEQMREVSAQLGEILNQEM